MRRHRSRRQSLTSRALGAAIRATRAEHGLSQEALARMAEIERSYYGAIERGEFNITLDTLTTIAAGLGVRPSSLLHRARL